MTKRNRIEISVNGLLLAVAVVVALMISALAFYMVNKAKNAINDGNTQYSELLGEYSEISSTIYDGLFVSGGKVTECIKKMTESDDISITVITAMGSASGYTYTGKNHVTNSLYDLGQICQRTGTESPYDQLQLSNSDPQYINPSASFLGKVTKNANGMVANITFTQK